MTWIYVLLALFAVLNIGDGLSTYSFVQRLGIEAEKTKAMRAMMYKYGVVPTILFAKGMVIAVVVGFTALGYFTGQLETFNNRTFWALALGAGCIYYAYYVANNLDIID